jgi:hypothetical protein
MISLTFPIRWDGVFVSVRRRNPSECEVTRRPHSSVRCSVDRLGAVASEGVIDTMGHPIRGGGRPSSVSSSIHANRISTAIRRVNSRPLRSAARPVARNDELGVGDAERAVVGGLRMGHVPDTGHRGRGASGRRHSNWPSTRRGNWAISWMLTESHEPIFGSQRQSGPYDGVLCIHQASAHAWCLAARCSS